jgi:uncharacterized protein YukE
MIIRTIARLKAPQWGGKLTVQFASNFRRIPPNKRMDLLNQALRQIRAEYDLAAEHHRIERRDEDVRNAEALTASVN